MPDTKVDFSKTVSDDQVFDCVMKNYSTLGKDWIAHQWTWINNIYQPFNEHIKYMIIITLVEKTLQFYDQMNIQLTYDQYYSKSYIQIEKFSITEICEKLNLPKETIRRKVLELEVLGVLKRKKKQIIIDRSAFKFVKPENQIKYTTKYIYSVSKFLIKENIYSKKIDLDFIENTIKKNFSICWRWFYRLQIPMINGYNKIFQDLTTFHTWGTVVMNQAFNYSNNFDTRNINSTNQNYMAVNADIVSNLGSNSNGVSAMSISDMTNIPRATVVRKCKFLIKHNFLKLNEKKQYTLTGSNIQKLTPYQGEVLKGKAKFLRKILNLCLIS